MLTTRRANIIFKQNSLYIWHSTPITTCLSLAICANFLFLSGHDNQRIAEFAVLVGVALFAIVKRPRMVGTMFASPGGRALAAFFVLGAASSAFAFSPHHAYVEIASFVLLYLLAMLVGDEIACNGRAAILRPIRLIALGCMLHGLNFTMAYYGALTLHIPLDRSDFTSGFSNIRFFNHAQTTLLPLFILLCCSTPRAAPLRLVWMGLASFWWVTLFATSARGTCMGIAAALAVAVLVRRRNAVPYLKQAAVTAVIGVLAYVILFVAVPAMLDVDILHALQMTLDRTKADPTSSRLPLWSRAVELTVHHPLFGIGPMHFAHETWNESAAGHPHDWLLQIAAEWGMPALLCLLSALFIGCKALLQRAQSLAPADVAEQAIATALLVTAVAILVDGLVSGVIVMPQSQLAIALYAGCAMGWYRMAKISAVSISARWSVVSHVVIVAAAAVLMAGAGPGAIALLQDAPATEAQLALNKAPFWPRLWKLGHF